MTPGTLNMELTTGDGYSHIITFQDSAGAALDQSAYTWRAQIRVKHDSATATAYPINSIEYRPYDSGHITALSLGDPVLAMQGQMERLVRRLQDVTAEVRN
jgi:hypothetical protein